MRSALCLLALVATSAVTASALAQSSEEPLGLPPPPVGDRPRDAAPPPTAPPPIATGAKRPNAGYDDGFFIQSTDGAHRLVAGGRLQTRFGLVSDEAAEEDRFELAVPRAWIKLNGHVLTPDLTFRMYADVAQPSLLDAYVDYRFVSEIFHLRVGQWRKPFGRPFIADVANMPFVERSIAETRNGPLRDLGLAVHNDYETSPMVEYVVGVFNGFGITDPDQLGQFDPLVVARIGYNHEGMNGYTFVERDGVKPTFGVALGASARLNADEDGMGEVIGNADFIFKAYHFVTTVSLYTAWIQDGPQFKNLGYDRTAISAQAGYMVANLLQPSVRYAHISRRGADNDVQEILGALAVDVMGSAFRLQVEGGAVLTDSSEGSSTGYVFRNQLHLDF